MTRVASWPPARRASCRPNHLWGPAGVGERQRGERVSSGGGAAAGTWGRKTRPGTRAAAGAKNNARAPAPTAARRVPSGRASARARSGVPRAHSAAPEALAARGGAAVARGSRAPGSAQARQSPPGSAEAQGGWRRPPGPPRPTRGHRLLSFAPPPTGRGDPSGPGSRPAVRIVVSQAGSAGAGRTPPPTVSHRKPSRPEAQRARGSAAPGVQPQPRTRNRVPSHPVPAGLPRWSGPIFYAETVLLRALGLLNSTDMMTACQDLG